MDMLPKIIDTLFINCRAATMAGGVFSTIEPAAIAVSQGKITWVGRQGALPEQVYGTAGRTIDCRNQWVLPGFIDCHTHLVWGGSRSNEFEMRLAGATYEEISKQGGGIVSTVKATRKASEDILLSAAEKRIKAFLNQGVTTIEIKSGYGLDLDTELKMLDVIYRLSTAFPMRIEATFLGAHTLPEEFKDKPDDYVDLVVHTMLPAVKKQKIATAVDVFCETMAFSAAQTRTIFTAAQKAGLNIKLHAEQLSDSGGAALAAEMGALSCDHLEYLSPSGAKAMAKHGVTAVLLPGAFYFLKETRKPPIRLLRELGVPMAVSTDLNPGTSPLHSIPLALNMACVLFGLTCEEAVAGATIHAARALGLDTRKGSIETGKDADLVVWDIDRPADICYLAGLSPVSMVMINGGTAVDNTSV